VMRKVYDRKKIRRLIGEGKTYIQIARELGCHPTTISYIARKEFGLTRKPKFTKKKYMPDKVVEYAKKILPKCKSRQEIVEKTAKHFKLSPGTVGHYFCLVGFRTGFRSLTLKRFWEEVRKGKREEPKQVQPTTSLAVLKKLQERPRFSDELTRNEIHACWGTLKRHNLIRVFRFPHRTRGSVRTRYGRIGKVIYFLPHQKLQAYKMLKKRFGETLGPRKRSILKIFKIPYLRKNGVYYHKETGEKL